MISQTNQSKWNHSVNSLKNDRNNYVRLHPNPALGYVIAETHFQSTVNTSFLMLGDANGKILKTIPLYNSDDEVVIPLSQFSGGTYFVSLFNDKLITSVVLIVLTK